MASCSIKRRLSSAFSWERGFCRHLQKSTF